MVHTTNKHDIVLTLYRSHRTVFRLTDIALLTNEADFQSLNNRINYAVRTGKLLNPRKGIYAKPCFNKEELACSVFSPSYLSLEYVLQKAGVVFQYDSSISSVSYLRRTIEIENQEYRFRKIKTGILTNTIGIIRQNNHVNMASPERAFLDLLYLETDYYFDNLNPLSKKTINQILPIYQSKALTQKVKKLMMNDGYQQT